jgi:hypothetical protein
MRRIILSSSLAILILGLATVTGSQESDPVEKVMELKLDYTHKVLENIIKQDFIKLEELSFQLVVLTGTEDWKVIRTEEYNRYTADFVGAVEALKEAREHRDINESAKAYNDMTLSCVQCHKYVREYQDTLNKP